MMQPKSAESVASFVGSIQQRGVQLWTDQGQLHYRAPKGRISKQELEALRESKEQVIFLLSGVTGAEAAPSPTVPGLRSRVAPLTYSQLAHWNLYRLFERRAIRQITAATRLRGHLDLDALRSSLAEVVRRHEALRTRIVVRVGVPAQEIRESVATELCVEDLTSLPEGSLSAVVGRRAEEIVLEPIDPSAGPLLAVHLLKFAEGDHVLVAAMEHMISDAFSMAIFLRDLFTAYAQAESGVPISLPAVPVQFADYAIRQRDERQSWMQLHYPYWSERLKDCRRLRFPADESLPEERSSGWGLVPLRIGRSSKAELREWCRMTRTTMVMAVFTAYVAAVLRWCHASDAVFLFQANGRDSAVAQNTIGYFASPLYLRIRDGEKISLLELLHRVTAEYCGACEHADNSYFEAQEPRPEFTRNSCFNWVPLASKIDPELAGSERAISRTSLPLGHPMLKHLERDTEPFVVLYEEEDEIVGDVYFALDRFSSRTMEAFASNVLGFIRALLRGPRDPLRSIPLLT